MSSDYKPCFDLGHPTYPHHHRPEPSAGPRSDSGPLGYWSDDTYVRVPMEHDSEAPPQAAMIGYGESTMTKVATGLRRAGLPESQVIDAIMQMQNEGILFRERELTPDVDAVMELCDAIRLTVEYVGTAELPPIAGWSWYDALVKYAPDMAVKFTEMSRTTAGLGLSDEQDERRRLGAAAKLVASRLEMGKPYQVIRETVGGVEGLTFAPLHDAATAESEPKLAADNPAPQTLNDLLTHALITRLAAVMDASPAGIVAVEGVKQVRSLMEAAALAEAQGIGRRPVPAPKKSGAPRPAVRHKSVAEFSDQPVCGAALRAGDEITFSAVDATCPECLR